MYPAVLLVYFVSAAVILLASLALRTFHYSIVRFVTFRQLIAQTEYLNMFRTTVLCAVVTITECGLTVITLECMWFEVHASLLLKLQDLLECVAVFPDVMTDCGASEILGDF